MKKIATIVAVACQLAFLASAAIAQDYRGRIQGTVHDASGGVLPGVAITTHNSKLHHLLCSSPLLRFSV
jgi:hypothetical protein